MFDRDKYYLSLNSTYLKNIKIDFDDIDIKSNFKIVSSNNGMPVLTKNGVPMNSMENPYEECKLLFSDLSYSDDKICIIFGLELGYTLKYACNHYTGKIVLIENDFETIKYVLQKNNLMQYLSNRNLIFITNFNRLNLRGKKIYIVANKYYSEVFSEILENIQPF